MYYGKNKKGVTFKVLIKTRCRIKLSAATELQTTSAYKTKNFSYISVSLITFIFVIRILLHWRSRLARRTYKWLGNLKTSILSLLLGKYIFEKYL